MLLGALGIRDLSDLGELVGRTVLVEFTKSGLEPLPNFLPPDRAVPLYTNELQAA
ncbi:hypothetical protein PESP_a1744 [Pseudoalteromonas espejiana DSM 9414]|nr:hypothetical protein PESP_a1744 [Pseudoalteromonas espejiana DSM 9414]